MRTALDRRCFLFSGKCKAGNGRWFKGKKGSTGIELCWKASRKTLLWSYSSGKGVAGDELDTVRVKKGLPESISAGSPAVRPFCGATAAARVLRVMIEIL
ncbi:hypothetical protein NNL21_23545 [Paenibacillus mendelii]|uniref:hypothetical protein n=1 Tax=Paenibacillus mendelii TaxID=206163 RepID=UPI00195B933A|nr:hypothetical protein [Paenibacillus mendelii]